MYAEMRGSVTKGLSVRLRFGEPIMGVTTWPSRASQVSNGNEDMIRWFSVIGVYLAEIGMLAGAGEELEAGALRTMLMLGEWCC